MNNLVDQILNSGLWDILAFLLSLIYVILAAKKNSLCWIFAFIASIIYVFLCFNSKLYIDSILQFFYAIMAIVGWFSWRSSTNVTNSFSKDLALKKHFIFIILCVLFSFLLGWIFKNYTDQAFPFIDAGIFSFSIFATFLSSQKKPSNWLYFIVIDLVACPIYWNRDLQLLGILNLIFAALAIFGFISWIKNKSHA